MTESPLINNFVKNLKINQRSAETQNITLYNLPLYLTNFVHPLSALIRIFMNKIEKKLLKKHTTKGIPFFRNGLGRLGTLGPFKPSFADVLEDHVEMSVESLQTAQDFSVVSAGNEDLLVGSNGSKEH